MKVYGNTRLAAVVSFIAVGVLALTACGGAEVQDDGQQASDSGGAGGEESVTIRVATAVDRYPGYMPVIAHEELGTFEGKSFNVEVISASTPTIGQILAGGQADVALAGGPALVAHAEAGVPVQLVAKILSPWEAYMIVSNESDYAGATSIEEMQGANFGITGQGSPGNYLLNERAEQLGWSDADFRETALGDVGSLFGALTDGGIDATIWAPDQAYVLEKEGVATYFKLDDPHPTIQQAIGVTTGFLEDYPGAVKEFLEAYFDKVAELQENTDVMVDVMVDWGMDRDVAERLSEDHMQRFSTDGVPTEEELEGLAQAVPFMSGNPEEGPPSINYTPWPEL